MGSTDRTATVAIDMGGSFLKRGIVAPREKDWPTLRTTFGRSRMHDREGRTVSDVLVEAVASGLADAQSLGIAVRGIGICSPGPFDWERGISLMTHKFASIRGVSLDTELRRRLELSPELPVRFMPDTYAFAAGERAFGCAARYERCVYLTLGTGIGSAFSEGGRIFMRHPDIPPSGSLWNAAYRDGSVEDYISRKAIIEGYLRATGGRREPQIDVDTIHAKARAGDEAAVRVFAELGSDLGAVVRQYALGFKPNCIVIGGGLAPCMPLVVPSMQKTMGDMPELGQVTVSALGEYGPLLGIEAVFEEGYRGG